MTRFIVDRGSMYGILVDSEGKTWMIEMLLEKKGDGKRSDKK
jgi:hypothetical protein